MNLTYLGFALAAAIAPDKFALDSCPAKANQEAKPAEAVAANEETRRFPSLAIGEQLPETPLQSLRRLVAIRNAEDSLDVEPAIELISENDTNIESLDSADELIEVAIEQLASTEPMPAEVEAKPEAPIFVSSDDVSETVSFWTEPIDIASLLELGPESVVLTTDQVAATSVSRPYDQDAPMPPLVDESPATTEPVVAEVVETGSTIEDDLTQEPVLPEFADERVAAAELDPFQNGDFFCGKADAQSAKQVAQVERGIEPKRVPVTFDDDMASDATHFFDDDYEELDEMIEYERLAMEAAIRTLR